MFRHNKESITNKEEKTESVVSDSFAAASKINQPETIKTDQNLKELIEKNLKWSQIIYEQNRKINNKLLWSAIANWLRLFVILAPIILAVIFLPPLFKNVWSQYNGLLGKVPTSATSTQQSSMDNLLKLFNLDPAKQEQIKALLK